MAGVEAKPLKKFTIDKKSYKIYREKGFVCAFK